MSQAPKQFLDPGELMKSSVDLGKKILDSDFRPDFIVAIWRGGTPVGIVIQELFEYHGFSTDHIAIRTSYYDGINQTRDRVRVHGLEYLIRQIDAENSLLIVDDVFDSGKSIEATLDTIRQQARRNTPEDIRIATPYYKPNNNQTDFEPDYYVHSTSDWLVFPHELQGLTEAEIREHKAWMHAATSTVPKKQ